MTWKSKTMPDDALTDCLVGVMLQGQQEISGDGSGEALPEIDEPVAKAARVAVERPLCELMFEAWLASDHYGTSRGMADVLGVVRDWMVPHERTTPLLPGGYEETMTRGFERLRIRDLLTQQAQIARATS